MSPTRRSDPVRATPSPPGSGSASATSGASPKSSPVEGSNLLAPVVRSKRTPIACTECRRRQVKCSGGSPRCERCEKRGVKCEYIPCSQQKASSSSPSTPPSAPEALMPQPLSPYFSTQPSPGSSPSWQQMNGAYQDYFPEISNAYGQGDHHWQNQGYPSLSPSNMQIPQQQFYGGPPAHSRAARPAYSGEDLNQPTFSYQTYGQGTSVQSTIPSHPGYSVGSLPNGYGAPDAHTVPADPSLSYGYGGGQGGHGRTALQAHLASQRATYAGQYHHGGNRGYPSSGGTSASDFTNQAWTSDVTFMHGAPYS